MSETVTEQITIAKLVEKSHGQSIKSGFWGDDGKKEYNMGEKLALIHEEVSECLGEIRSGHAPTEVYFVEDKNGQSKPEGFPIELADIIIRICDLVGREGIDLESAILTKMTYNSNRPHRHGRAF